MIEHKAAQETIIEDGATIGRGTTIGKYCFIGKNVTIGEGNTIASHVVIEGNTIIGNNNTIGTHTVLGTAPQDTKTISDKIGLSIGNNNQIEDHVFITAGTDHGGLITKIADNNRFMKKIHIGHDVHMGSYCTMEENAALGGHVVVNDYVVFGKNTAVHQFVEIGTHAELHDDAALTQDLPPYCIAEGNRAKITGLNIKSIKKHYSKSVLLNIDKAYSLLFGNNSPKENAIELLNQKQPEECNTLYSFVAESKRGIPFKRNMNVDQEM